MRGLWRSLSIYLDRTPYPLNPIVFALLHLSYALLFILLRPLFGSSTTGTALVPTAIAGACFGIRGGLWSGLISLLINVLLLEFFDIRYNDLLSRLALHGSSLFVTGLVVGWLSETRQKLRINLQEQKITEIKLHLSEDRYRHIVEEQNELICRFLPDGTLTFVNEAYSHFFQESPEQPGGQRFDVLMSKEERQALAMKLSQLTPENPAVSTEHASQRLDGAPVWLQWSDRAIFNENGQVVEYQAVGRDVTQRKQTELRLLYTHAQLQQAYHDLEESRRRLYALFEYALDPILFSNDEGLYVNVNPAACKLTGYTWQEMCQMTQWDITPPNHREVAQRLWERFLQEGKQSGETPVACKDGSIRYVEYRAVAHIVPGLHVSINRDVTERKLAEERLEYLSNHDGLTRLYNRRYFETAYEQMIEMEQLPVTIIYCDVDHLKQVNDQMGHQAGDELLKTTAALLRSTFRPQDVIARLGGDEFAILLPQTPPGASQRVLERLQIQIEANNLTHPDLPLSLSCGAATLLPGQDRSWVLHQADLAMFEEKGRRRGIIPPR